MEQGMTHLTNSWQFWAILAAIFAALTAIFAKVGVEDVDSDFATFLRTIVVVAALGLLVWVTGKVQNLGSITPRTWLFLVLSGLATGASWLCYFKAMKLGDASQVAPVDKLSVVLVAIIAAIFLGEKLSGLGWSGIGLVAVGSIMVAVG
jgi:transporter family protein